MFHRFSYDFCWVFLRALVDALAICIAYSLASATHLFKMHVPFQHMVNRGAKAYGHPRIEREREQKKCTPSIRSAPSVATRGGR